MIALTQVSIEGNKSIHIYFRRPLVFPGIGKLSRHLCMLAYKWDKKGNRTLFVCGQDECLSICFFCQGEMVQIYMIFSNNIGYKSDLNVLRLGGTNER